MSIDSTIFRAYDIRGVYGKTLTNEVATRLADAFVLYVNPTSLIIGQDMRESSPVLTSALIQRFNELGILVKDIGMVSTEVFYYACGSEALPGIMVTASHNPSEYNGFKLIKQLPYAIGKDYGMEEIRDFVIAGKKAPETKEKGITEHLDIWPTYIDAMCDFVDEKNMPSYSVVIDAANGMGGVIWERLEKRLPIKLKKLFFKPDGTFPNHEPDPLKAENRVPTEEAVKKVKADVGFSYDADVDRCFVIDDKGESIPSEFITALMADYFLEKYPGGGVIYDVRSSWVVRDEVIRLGGKPIIERVGHSYIKRSMQDRGAVLGGEVSGHFYSKDFFNADSGIVTTMIVLSIIQKKGKPLSGLIADWRKKYHISGEINFTVDDPKSLLEELKKIYSDGKLSEIDGILIEYQNWHFSVRSSNTEPVVRLNLEAIDSKELLEEKKSAIIKIIESYT